MGSVYVIASAATLCSGCCVEPIPQRWRNWCCSLQYGTRKRLRSVLLTRNMYDCIVPYYARIHGVNTIERRYGSIIVYESVYVCTHRVSIVRIVSTHAITSPIGCSKTQRSRIWFTRVTKTRELFSFHRWGTRRLAYVNCWCRRICHAPVKVCMLFSSDMIYRRLSKGSQDRVDRRRLQEK